MQITLNNETIYSILQYAATQLTSVLMKKDLIKLF